MIPLRIGILGAARIADDGIVAPARVLGHEGVAVAARDRALGRILRVDLVLTTRPRRAPTRGGPWSWPAAPPWTWAATSWTPRATSVTGSAPPRRS